jgi:phosphate transport system protein
MSTSRILSDPSGLSCAKMLELTMRGCDAASSSAEALTEALAKNSKQAIEAVKKHEEELDRLDSEINEGVTRLVTQGASEKDARELLACLKFVLELERISDLLWNVANRFSAVGPRLDAHDVRELEAMSSIVQGMMTHISEAFAKRDVERALLVLRNDAELDRLRNLMFIRHVENPEKQPVRESYHLVFMSQSLERAGDHAKNLAEEICHLVTGRSMRHIQRQYEKPVELARNQQRKKPAR